MNEKARKKLGVLEQYSILKEPKSRISLVSGKINEKV
jgi:hypothetical protein